MLESSPTVVTVKYKRRNVSAVRDFPEGCGRLDAVDDLKLREEPPASVGLKPLRVCSLEEKPLPNGAVDKHGGLPASVGLEPLKISSMEEKPLPDGADDKLGKELLASVGLESLKVSTLEENPLPNNAANLPVAEEKASLDKVESANSPEGLKQEALEESAVSTAGSTEGLELKGVELSKRLEVLGTETKEEEEDDGKTAFAGKSDKLDGLELAQASLEQSWSSDGSKVDEGLKKQSISRVHPPPKRRKVSAARDFPVGCGPNAPLVVSEECAKVAAAASPKSKCLDEKTKLSADEKPAAEVLSKISSAIALADVVEKGDNIDKIQESVQEYNPAIASPETMSLNDEKEPLVKRPSAMEGSIKVESAEMVENGSGSQVQSALKRSMKEDAVVEHYQNKILAGSASDKRITGREIKIVNKNLRVKEAKTTKLSSLDVKSQSGSKLIDKKGKSSVQKVKEKSLMMPQKDTTNLKRKISGYEGRDLNCQNQRETSDSYGNRLIIQALIAAQNCPWRHGRKSGGIGSHSVTPKSRVKKVKLLSKRSALKQVENEDDFLPQNEENEKVFTRYGGPDGLQESSVTMTPLIPSEWSHKGGDGDDVSARMKVKRALRLFQLVSRKLLQSEEAKAGRMDKITRIDLKAAEILKNKKEFVNTGKAILGSVPGVEVGDEFQYRVELSVVGLHRLYQGGIDSVERDGVRLATSIVASGGYPDEMDGSDVLIYSGSGGNPVGGSKRPEDQKLERGNLALKNSMEAKTPVRVIRGFKELKGSSSHDARSKMVSTFNYDGLYFVEKYWQEKGQHGCFVFKFQLRRMAGQPELALKEVKKTKKSRVREGLCLNDISGGKEKIPICVINTIDNEQPPPFNYITSTIYPSWYVQTPPKGCDCTSGCFDSAKCACAFKNGGEIPFNFNGAIVQAKPLVYECGPSCKCPSTCYNRVSQHGIKIPLEIFKTKSRGWGVRSLYSIPSGSFICEYIGELLKDTEAEQRTNDEYLFDIGHNYDDHSLWEGLPTLIPDLLSTSHCETVEDLGYTIDADKYGNVGRFINHSCSPNLYAQNVLYDHDDKRMPHIMFFAADNIPPLQELTYHYNYTIDQVRDSKGNIKRKDCYCGSPECCGRLY